MRLGVLATIYNEGLFFDYSIRSYIDHVDAIAIVERCVFRNNSFRQTSQKR